MPRLHAFRGLRYAEPAQLKSLVCPPYDIISPAQQADLHERDPHNAVRLELAGRPGESERYRNVGGTVSEWLSSGVLMREVEPALYVYRQDFEHPTDGEPCRVVGAIGALELEEFGGSVLPHERTMAGPKQDRLELMRAAQMNVSPIFAIYRGSGALKDLYRALEVRPPVARFVDDEGVLTRLWVVTAAAEIATLEGALSEGPLVIADGHHRYETALAYRDEQDGPGLHDSIMCFCVDADDADLVVLPYNRVLRTGGADVVEAAREIGARSVDDPLAALEASGSDHPFVIVTKGETLLVEVGDDEVVAAVGERAAAWRALDVVALHEVVLPRLLAGQDPADIAFTRDPDEVVAKVREGEWDLGILLRSLDAPSIVEVATSGERMPQKASYFWPKALTGLVFNPLKEPS